MKDYCPNETDFETRVERNGRSLFRCTECGRVNRTTRRHQKPGRTTTSHDSTMGILWDGAAA